MKFAHDDAASLFASDCTGRDISPMIMSFGRFLSVLSFIRFDSQEIRELRKASDKCTAVRGIKETFT